MPQPWESAPKEHQIKAAPEPWESAPPEHQAESIPGWQDSGYGFKVRPIDINGVKTVQRSDGAAFFGPDQGNKGKPGWFGDKGQRVGDAPGKPAPKSTMESIADNALYNPITMGATDLLGGYVVQPLANIPGVPSGVKNWVNSSLKGREEGFSALPMNQTGLAPITRGIAAVAATAPLGGGGTVSAPNVGFVSAIKAAPANALRGAAAGTAYAVGMPAVLPENATLEDYARAKVEQAYEGGKWGGAFGAAGPVVVGAAKSLKANNPLARAFGNKASRQAALDRAESIRTSTQSAAYPEGVEPSLGESMQNPSVNAAENTTEYIPFSGRKSQLEKGNTALRAKLQEMADVEKPGLGLTGAGPEIAESAKNKLVAAKESFREPYQFVRDVAGDTPPVRENTIRAFDEAIGKETGISGKNSPEVKALQTARDSFAKGETGRNFTELEQIQDRIQYDAAHNSQSPDPGVKALGRYARDISRGVGEDMHATIAKADPTGLSSDIYKATNKAYGKKVRQYEPNQSLSIEGTRKEARSFVAPEGFEDKIPDRIFQGDNAGMAKYTYEALDDQGRKAVRGEILRRALEAGDDSKIFSPNKAATALDKHDNFIKEFFSPSEQKQIAGFNNALRDMERSGQYLEKLGTGKFQEQMKHTTAPLTAVGTAVATSSPVPLIIGTSTMPLARVYNKLSGAKAGKEWLLGMAKVKPNSLLMKTMMNRLPALVGTKAGEPETKEPE